VNAKQHTTKDVPIDPPDLLEPLKVIPELHVKGVGNDLGESTILVVLLPVKEPVGDLELAGVGNDSHEALKLLWGQLTSPAQKCNHQSYNAMGILPLTPYWHSKLKWKNRLESGAL
jgi:hypothetical protein